MFVNMDILGAETQSISRLIEFLSSLKNQKTVHILDLILHVQNTCDSKTFTISLLRAK